MYSCESKKKYIFKDVRSSTSVVGRFFYACNKTDKVIHPTNYG